MENDFYETDEEVRDIVAAFGAGAKSVTQAPRQPRIVGITQSYTNGSYQSQQARFPAPRPFTQSAPVLG